MHQAAFSTLLALTCAASLSSQDRVHGHLFNFLDNGAWSWFEDERAIVDTMRGHILVSSCADSSGIGGGSRGGDIDVAWLDVAGGRFGRFELHDRLQGDDHNSAALLVRPDGRYLAMYGTHGGSGAFARTSRWRISRNPGDPSAWEPERGYVHPTAMSYSNLFHLRSTGRTYNFVRAINWDPNVMVSTDQGRNWTGGGKLLTSGGSSTRPYVKYASDGDRRIHLITTEQHPRNSDTSIYHGYVENDRLHTSTGGVIDPTVLDGLGVSPTRLTPVFRAGTVVGGIAMRRSWTIDLAVDPGGVLRALFQTRANGSENDHRLFFGRFDGRAWSVHEVCRMGGPLYSAEQDYTGLGALHPEQPGVIYLSTPIDPRSGRATANHEIYKAMTGNRGTSWTFTPVTEGSTVDNLRPIIPAWSADRTAVLWMRGSYSTYTNYDLAIVGILEAPELEIGKLTYIDATTQNTTDRSGGPANPTGPAAGQGATDNRWHVRTGFGAGGQVWTSSERGTENAPELRTRVAVPAPGRYDVFVTFWSNTSQDWAIRAGFAPGVLRNLEKRGAEAIQAVDFVNPPTLTGSTVRHYMVWLGRTEVGSNRLLDVYVDDYGSGQQYRSWYDGIAIAPIECRASTQKVGNGCNGSQALELSAAPRLGTSIDLTMGNAAPGALGLMLLGGGDLQPVSMAPAGFPGCAILVNGGLTLPLGTVDANGSTPRLSLAIPNSPSLNCVRIGMQAAAILGTLRLTPALVLLPGR